MKSRQALSCGRLLYRELTSETTIGSKQLIRGLSSAVTTTQTTIQLPPSRFQGTSVVLPFAARSQSTDSSAVWNTILYPDSELEIGAPAPDFSAPAVVDNEITDVKMSDYKGKYIILFFYPKDFTFVCPTEIIAFSDRAKEFEALNCQLIAASTDTPEVHLAWIKTSRKRGGLGFMQIPILADVTKEISARYGVLKRDAGIALRGLYIINPEGIVEHVTMNNFPVGRSVDEALRTLQAIQFVAEHGEVCPAGWKPGEKTMIADPEKSLDYFESAASSLHEGGGGGGDDDDEAVVPSAFTAVTTKKQYENAVAGSGDEKVVGKFWADWCGKCKSISPFAEELTEKYGNGMKFVSVNTTEEQMETFVSELGVKALPVFKFYKGGKEVVKEVIGYKKQPLENAFKELEQM